MAKPKTPPVLGYIKISDTLVRCTLIKISQATHRRTVRLNEDFKAFSAGDKITVGPGEFVKDDQEKP